jgi:(S)-2-hydroxyglutarate dehydrogenase
MSDDITFIDVAIAGSGIIGLMNAYYLKKKYPEDNIVVFDQTPYPGEHSSGRNSGVLHAGLYYEENSLKHQFCIRGNKLWKELSKELNTPINNCGKYVIAKNDEEVQELEKLFKQAQANGVEVSWAKESEVKKLDDFCYVKKAFF